MLKIQKKRKGADLACAGGRGGVKAGLHRSSEMSNSWRFAFGYAYFFAFAGGAGARCAG